MGEVALIVGAICLLAAIAGTVSIRFGVPTLVTFLVIGMLLGSDGPGGVAFDDPELAERIATVCLIAILWAGGIGTRWDDVRPVIRPASVLATFGVVVTAVVVALAAGPLLGLDPLEAMLVGAVVGSTDAAAIFATLRFVRVRPRTARLLESESGLNDPMAIALTVGLIAWVNGDTDGVASLLVVLARELGVGLVAAGLVVALMVVGRRHAPFVTPFAPLVSIGLAAVSFGIADALGGSGFLAVYLVGMAFGTMDHGAGESLRTFHEGLSFAAELGLFLMLGLLVFPSELPPVILPGLAIAAVLAFVARPIAVALGTLGAGLGRGERVFLSWAGLRGAVPIVLATLVLAEGVSSSQEIFNAVFFVVLVSAALQGPTLSPLARRLGLSKEGARTPP